LPILMLTLILATFSGVLAQELPFSVGDEFVFTVKKAEKAYYYMLYPAGFPTVYSTHPLSKGDEIKVTITDITSAVVYADVYINGEKIISDGILSSSLFYLYMDEDYINNVWKPSKEALGYTVTGSGGDWEVSGEYEGATIEWHYDDYVLSYFHYKYSAGGVTTEIEISTGGGGGMGLSLLWIGVGVAAVVIIVGVLFFLKKKSQPA